MADISQWNVAAASNNTASPDGAPEGMAPSGVNDTIREVMAAVARWYSDSDGTLTTAGTGNAYTLTTNGTHAALADMPVTVFRVDRANTGSATLNVDGLGAKTMNVNGAALASGMLVINTVVAAAYNATSDVYDLFGVPSNSATILTAGELPDARLSSNVPLLNAGNTFTANGFASGTAAIDIDSTLPVIRLAESDQAADEKVWLIDVSGGSFIVQTRTDADGAGESVISVTRTGTNADTVNLAADAVTANSKTVLTETTIAALTNITVADTQPTDSLYINDAGAAKQIDIQDMGVRVVELATVQTFALGDVNTLQTLTGTTDRVWTIPANATVAFGIGSIIYLAARDTAKITVTAAAGVTLTSVLGSGAAGSDDVSAGGMAALIKVATDEWMLSGDIA